MFCFGVLSRIKKLTFEISVALPVNFFLGGLIRKCLYIRSYKSVHYTCFFIFSHFRISII